MKEEYNNETLLSFQPHMVQLVLMKYVTMHSLHRLSFNRFNDFFVILNTEMKCGS